MSTGAGFSALPRAARGPPLRDGETSADPFRSGLDPPDYGFELPDRARVDQLKKGGRRTIGEVPNRTAVVHHHLAQADLSQ